MSMDIKKLDVATPWPTTPDPNTLYFKLVNGEEFEMRFSTKEAEGTFLTFLSEKTTSRIIPLAASEIDCSLGDYFVATVNGNTTFTITNIPTGKAYSATLRLTVVSGSITFPGTFKWPNDVAPTFTAGKVYLISLATENDTVVRAAVLPPYSA